jgi:hypothetical protein
LKIKVVAYCFALILVLTSLNLVISVKSQSTVSKAMMAELPENEISVKLRVSLSYKYAFWSDTRIQAFGTMKIYIRNPTPIVETVTITMPGQIDIAGTFEGSYETTYDTTMKLITVISIPNKVSYSVINFVYPLNNRYILGLAYVHLASNVINQFEIRGLNLNPDDFKAEIRFFLPSNSRTCQGSPFPAPDIMTPTQIVYVDENAQNVYPTIWYRSDISIFISLVYCVILSLIPYTIVAVSKKRKFLTRNVLAEIYGRATSGIKSLNIVRMTFFCLILTSVIMLSTVVAIGPNSRPQLITMAP